MKFSVIIPLYNGAATIRRTLDSVLAQTYTDYEIVLVNDGSPDNVGEVVKKYIQAHPEAKFIYVEQKNKGLGGARNTAIKHASGEIIAILDQDDLWYPKKLEKVAKAYKENPEASVISHNLNVREDEKIIRIVNNGPYEANMHRALLFIGNRLSTPAVTFKRSILDEVGCFSEDKAREHLVEDYDLWMRMALTGYHFYFIPEILGEYVQHDNNLTVANFRQMINGELNIIHRHYKLLKNKRPLDWYRLRRIKAMAHLKKAYRLYSLRKSKFELILTLITAFILDPAIFVRSFIKAVRKLIRISLRGRLNK